MTPPASVDTTYVDGTVARLALGTAGTIDRLVTRTAGQLAVGRLVGRVVGRSFGLRLPPRPDAGLEAPRVHPVHPVPLPENVTPLRPSGHRSAKAVSPAVPTVDELPIPGYDELAASQVVKRLGGLNGEELEAVATYENAHRRRRTILAQVSRLRTGE